MILSLGRAAAAWPPPLCCFRPKVRIPHEFNWEKAMDIAMDAAFLVLIIAFFAASAVLVRFCAGLLEQGNKS
jgi:hypothetical protein